MPDVDLAVILADGDYLKREGDALVGDIPGGVPFTGEDAVDATAASLAAGTHTNVTVTYDDAAGSISLAATGAVLAQTVETVAGTTYTVVTADSNKIKSLTGTATVTLPSAGLAAGERTDFVCVGGAATFTLGAGATWHVAPTPSAVARAIGSFVTAVKMGATTWALTGDLA